MNIKFLNYHIYVIYVYIEIVYYVYVYIHTYVLKINALGVKTLLVFLCVQNSMITYESYIYNVCIHTYIYIG